MNERWIDSTNDVGDGCNKPDERPCHHPHCDRDSRIILDVGQRRDRYLKL